MTLAQRIESETGYKCFTTFDFDFTIAELFGESAIRDTYERLFNAFKGDTKSLTELVLILNWKIWAWYEVNEAVARVYDELWRKADEWACDNLKGEDAEYYYRTLD